jgi:hypothetical protein
MRYICAQPATNYYAWQVEVMINNFIKNGINPNKIDIVCSKNGNTPEQWSKLANSYPARFFFYDDTRKSKNYISSIRPNILKQHFLKHTYLSEETIFYHDCDMIFTKSVNFNKFEQDDDIFYGSDTRWYIGHDYIISKGEDILDKMCEIVNIDKKLVKENELNSIGAQYIMKNIGYEFWEKVENDSEKLFKEITDLNNIKKIENPKYHELQIWCADMWAVLWNIWKLDIKTVCHDDLLFAWGNSSVNEWDRLNIFHNAGVTNSTSGFFYKSDYINKIPYNDNLNIKKDTASYKYWQEIKSTAKITVL